MNTLNDCEIACDCVKRGNVVLLPRYVVGLGAPQAINRCMCVIVVTMRGWSNVGLWAAVCFLAKISLHRPYKYNRVCTFDTVTGNLAVISRFHHFHINERLDFFIFRYPFLYKITVSFTMEIKRSPGEQACRWRAVNFEIHLWSSGMNADCIWRLPSIQYVQI